VISGTCVPVYAVCLAAIACAVAGCAPAQVLTRAEAESLLNEYTNAVASGDSARVSAFWSLRSREREGFWTMSFSIGELKSFEQTREAMREARPAIRDVSSHDGYSVIELNWVPRDEAAAAPGRPMRYYVVHAAGQHRFINPIDLLPAEWPVHETEFFRFHLAPTLRVQDRRSEMDRLTREVRAIARQLAIALPDKMDYYCARTPEECGSLMLQRPSNGYAALAYGLIVSIACDNVHEAVHLIADRAGLNPGDGPLSEGLAVAFGGTTTTTADFAPLQASRFVADGRYVPLRELLSDQAAFFRRNYVTYLEAGAFVRYLFETHGTEKLKALLRSAGGSGDVPSALVSAYGRPLPDLERDFHAWLGARAAAEIGTHIPAAAESRFVRSDPVGDDEGDGDYRYPNRRFAAGVFDLTGFEVLADTARVYFRLAFARLDSAVSYEEDGEQFVPGAVVAVNRHRGERLGNQCHNVTFGEGRGYDLRLNVGLDVSLVSADGKVFWSSRNGLPRTSGAGDTLTFSLPAALIGQPGPTWEYFVGTGLVSDRTMDFSFAGLMPVVREAGVFIGGGNHEFGNPAFIDVLLPPERNQASLLSGYDPTRGKRPVVPMFAAGRTR